MRVDRLQVCRPFGCLLVPGILSVLCAAGIAAAEDLPGFTLTKSEGAGERYAFQFTPDKSKDTISGVIAYPAGAGPFPVVVMNHGSQDDAAKFLDRFGTFFLERDFAIFGCDLVPVPKDKDDRASVLENQRRLQAAITILAAQPRINSARIYLYGHGGGSSAAINFLSTTDKVKAVAVTGSGSFGKHEGKIVFATINVPVLILHGDRDEVTQLAGAERLRNAFRRAPVPAKLEVFKRETHELPVQRRLEVFTRIVEFFQAHP